MELSEQCESIIKDITSLFDHFEIPLKERESLEIPLVSAYFKGLNYQKQSPVEPTDQLREQVLYGLARDRTSKNIP